MAVGTRRTISRTITVGANSFRGFRQTVPGTIAVPHRFIDFQADDPGLDLVVFTVNGLHTRTIMPGDAVCFGIANNTAGSITSAVTVTVEELSPSLAPT